MHNLSEDQLDKLVAVYESVWATLFGVVLGIGCSCLITATTTKVSDRAWAILMALSFFSMVLAIILAILWIRDFLASKAVVVTAKKTPAYYVNTDGTLTPIPTIPSVPSGATIPTPSTATTPKQGEPA